MAPMEPEAKEAEREGELNNQLNLTKHTAMKVNMAMLIDFMLQKTYHDLSVMAELLPRKSDIERKIAIIEFATKSRQQFVRLLALVKWAASAERVDKCQVISSFLDQQSFLFVDTSDTLSRMARETLVNARLPAFCLPAAVDVLTTETYCRLPTCIRDRIIPADPITGTEKTKTLQRLDQVIQQRLVTSKLPSQMNNLLIADGRVKFTVKDEFEVTLTLMGDDPTVPWRLLSVHFLVQDFKTGDGKTLVHGLQVQYIHQLAQSRLFTEESPLVDLYNCLHSFCSLLQLEVLHSQAQRLVRERWAEGRVENVKIENYTVGQKLTLSYWRNLKQPKLGKENYSLSIVVVGEEQDSSLSICHSPPLKPSGNAKNVTISTKRLCIETILSETVQAQALAKLEIVRDILEKDQRVQPPVSLDSKIPELQTDTLVTSSICSVFVDSKTGAYDVAISNCQDVKLRLSCKNSLNKDVSTFTKIFRDVRCSLRIQQCIKSVQNLSTTSTSLPLVNFADHSLSQLCKHKLFMKFRTHPSYYLVMEVKVDEKTSKFCENYFLLKVKPSHSNYPEVKQSNESGRKASTSLSHKDEKRLDGFFLKCCQMVKLEPDLIADITSLSNHVSLKPTEKATCFDRKSDNASSKRMKTDCDVGKLVKSPPLPRVEEIFTVCDARIPFLAFCNEMNKAKVPYQNMNKDDVNLCVRILDIPAPSECDAKDVREVKLDLLDCTVSHDVTAMNQWTFDLVMANAPFKQYQTSVSQHVLFSYESESQCESSDEDICLINVDDKSVWSKFLDDWKCICHLYKHAKELDEYLQDQRGNLSRICSVHSFTYKELVLAYGPGFLNLVTVKWSEAENGFVFSFAHLGAEASGHQHEIINRTLQVEFSKHNNLPYVIQILHDTFSPFHSLSKLPTTPSLFRGATVSPAFTVIPQSSTRARLSYKNHCMLEFHFRAKQLVSVRDCAFNQLHFDKCKAPIQGISNLKGFLQLYNDELAESAAKNPYALNWDSFTTLPLAGHDVGNLFGAAQSVLRETPKQAEIVDIMQTENNGNRSTSRAPTLQGSSSFSVGYNELGPGVQRSSPRQGSVLRLSPITSLNLPVPSPAIPMSPTVSNYLTPSTTPAHFNPAPSSAAPYTNPIPSPATPYQLSVTSPATPQTGVPSPAIPANATSPGSVSWAQSPQLANTTGHHPRVGGVPRVPLQGSSSHVNPPRKVTSWSIVRSVLVSHASLDKIMTPTPVRATGGSTLLISPFEQFLGCQFLLRYFPRLVQNEHKAQVQHLRDKSDLAGLVFKTKNLKFSVILDTTTFTTLHLKVQPLPGQENAWSREDLQDLERFFDTKVVCYPYKLHNVTSFLRLIQAEQIILKDFIQIMRLELNKDPSHRWNVEWCLTIPPGDQRIRNIAGSPAAVVIRNKVLFFIQLTKSRSEPTNGLQDNAIIVPIFYYPENNNVTSLVNIATDPSASTSLSPHTVAVIDHLKNWTDTVSHLPGTCSIYPAVLSLLMNFVVPACAKE